MRQARTTFFYLYIHIFTFTFLIFIKCNIFLPSVKVYDNYMYICRCEWVGFKNLKCDYIIRFDFTEVVRAFGFRVSGVYFYFFHEIAYIRSDGCRSQMGEKKQFRKLPYLTGVRNTIVFSVQLFQLILRADQIKKFFFAPGADKEITDFSHSPFI